MKKGLSIAMSVLMLFIYSISAFADYENTYKNTGSYADDLIAVAKTQVGYTGKYDESKYGSIAEDDTISWSGAFLSWCAYQAAIPDSVIPKMASLTQIYSFFLNSSSIHTEKDYIPKAGDIAFFGEDEQLTVCGIVEDCDGRFITMIIGDIADSVQEMTYIVDAPIIYGYASPEYKTQVVFEAGTHITTASFLNFRKGPETSYDVICQIPLGTSVNITEIKNGWGKTVYNGSEGWLSMSYTTESTDDHVDTSKYGVRWNVIDVSKWQGQIDWNKIANADIKAVILRIGLRGSKTREVLIDDNFDEYYKGAKEAGLHIGCYFYSTALTYSEAEQEARFVIETIKDGGYQFDMPVFADMEDKTIETGKKESIQNITLGFIETMEEANFCTGVYCSTYWANDYYTPDMFENRALWIADWRSKCNYTGNYGMWQYSEKGSISGIESTYTDLNVCYIDYPRYIKDNSLNKVPSPNDERKLGDVDGDGKITAYDARYTLRAAAGIVKLSDMEKKAADVDRNGKVSPSDARKILRVAAKIEIL